MNERTLLIIAVIVIIIGLGLLFFASKTDLKETKASVEGTVKKVVQKKELTIAYITTDVPVVYFEEKSIKKGDHLLAQGRLQEYKGKLEFIVDE